MTDTHIEEWLCLLNTGQLNARSYTLLESHLNHGTFLLLQFDAPAAMACQCP